MERMSSGVLRTDGDPAADVAARLAARFGARDVRPLAPDASVRAFYRLVFPDGGTRIALVDPQGGRAALDRMVVAGALLEDIGVPVPRLDDRDDALTALLFEDLGDTLLADALPGLEPAERAAAYEEAGRIAGRIARHGTPRITAAHALATPRLHRERLRWELALWITQDVAGRRGIEDHGLFRELAAVCDRICAVLGNAAPQLAHRDFHARNLMVRPGRPLGVVDFQDTLLAPPLYDLASLVRDPYVEPDGALARAAAKGFADEQGGGDPLEEPLFAWVALQRDLKALGTYAFQARRRGRTRFLESVAPAERLARLAVDALPALDRGTISDVLGRIGI